MNLNKKLNIAVFTSTRAEYGLLFPLLKKINANAAFSLKLLVGGSHLLHSYGHTIDFIKKDNFQITSLFPFLEENKKNYHKHDELSVLSKQIGDYFLQDRPDIILILGDRYELLAIASVALVLDVPVGHISGGDITEGLIDNQVRHALAKIAHLHFPATEIARDNLLKMGEESWRICLAGEPGLDQILNMQYVNKEDLYGDLNIPLDKELIIATFHPETIGNEMNPSFVTSLLEQLVLHGSFHVLVTASNFDIGGREINNALLALCAKNKNITFKESLGQTRYYSILKYASLMIGNSSSGLVEAQSFKLPVLNVGKRQQGRLANANVMNVELDIKKIVSVIPYALSDDFKAKFVSQPNKYGDGHAADRILNFINENMNRASLLMKKDVF